MAMQIFKSLTGIAAPCFEANIDTDKLIPHRFLRKPLAAGYRNFLFHDQRFTPDGKPVESFVLNRTPYTKAQILVAGSNFGCGSTREGAVYALLDFGFRAVIAPSFGDIFEANCLQNGLLPVRLSEIVVKALSDMLEDKTGATVAIDLQTQTVVLPDDTVHTFNIDPERKRRMLKGLDDIGITLEFEKQIQAFEDIYKARMTWLPNMENHR
jgi:3-isopropylmalate/(R)-2-methylmalate dehydratase small subunit